MQHRATLHSTMENSPAELLFGRRYEDVRSREHTNKYLEDTDVGATYQGKGGRGPGAREQGQGAGLGEMALGMAAGVPSYLCVVPPCVSLEFLSPPILASLSFCPQSGIVRWYKDQLHRL